MLRIAVARTVRVGAVAKHCQHALTAQLAKRMKIGSDAVDRGLVELVVAGVDNRADRGCYGNPHAIGNAVAHVEELEPKRPDLEFLKRLDFPKVGAIEQTVLFEPRSDETQREPGAVDGRFQPGRT